MAVSRWHHCSMEPVSGRQLVKLPYFSYHRYFTRSWTFSASQTALSAKWSTCWPGSKQPRQICLVKLSRRLFHGTWMLAGLLGSQAEGPCFRGSPRPRSAAQAALGHLRAQEQLPPPDAGLAAPWPLAHPSARRRADRGAQAVGGDPGFPREPAFFSGWCFCREEKEPREIFIPRSWVLLTRISLRIKVTITF